MVALLLLVAVTISCESNDDCFENCRCRRSTGECYLRSIYTRSREMCSECDDHIDCDGPWGCVETSSGIYICKNCLDEAMEKAVEECISPSASPSPSPSPSCSSTSALHLPSPPSSSSPIAAKNRRIDDQKTLPQETTPAENETKPKISFGLTAGIAVGIVLALICVILLLVWVLRKSSSGRRIMSFSCFFDSFN